MALILLKKLREKDVQSKVIMLTAKSSLEDKLNGLENGANDYVTKPFHIEELVARANIQLKNNASPKKNTITFGNLNLNISSSTLECTTTKEQVELVCKEFQLMEYFINNPKQILSKEQIYDKIWGIENDIESNNIRSSK